MPNKTLENAVNILNTVRNTASDSFRNAVPEAKINVAGQGNIPEIGDAILAYEPFMNEFVGVLMNRIAYTLITNKIARNKLEVLKKGRVPLGTDIQDIISNPAKASPYDKDDFTDMLREKPVDSKVIYYRRNRQDKYKVTMYYDGLKGAFVDERVFMEYVASIVNTLYSGNFIDEYNLTKATLSNGFESGKFVTYKISDYTEASLKGVIKEIRADRENFAIPSANYNKFAEVYEAETGVEITPVTTWVDPAEQIIIITSDFLARLGVDVLASQFNLSEVEFRENMLVVDNFGFEQRTSVVDVNGHKEYVTERVESPLKLVHCDRGLFQIYENMFKFTTDYNGGNLAWQYWLHCWQTYGLRLWANCKMYYYDGTEPTPPTPTEDIPMEADAEHQDVGGMRYFQKTVNNLQFGTSFNIPFEFINVENPNISVSLIGIDYPFPNVVEYDPEGYIHIEFENSADVISAFSENSVMYSFIVTKDGYTPSTILVYLSANTISLFANSVEILNADNEEVKNTVTNYDSNVEYTVVLAAGSGDELDKDVDYTLEIDENGGISFVILDATKFTDIVNLIVDVTADFYRKGYYEIVINQPEIETPADPNPESVG